MRLAGLTAAALLGACTAAAPPSVTSLPPIAQITSADLQAALNIATVSGDIEGVACFGFLQANLASLSAPTPPVVGAISAFELAHIAVNTVTGGQNTALEQACGAYSLNIIGGINGLLAQFGVGASVVVKP